MSEWVRDGIETFEVNGAWQPVKRADAASVRTAEFGWAWRRFNVRSAYGNWHSGDWQTIEAAQRFARSMSGEAVAVEVEPYRWCPAWGDLGD
jgi:hypothetical protein